MRLPLRDARHPIHHVVGSAYWVARDMALDHDHCFLCGVLLDGTNRTDEHVFPRWLQREYQLWAQTIRLLNGSSIRYSALTIPCCRRCNEFWLAKIESQVSAAFKLGAASVKALDPIILSLWMAKIYYGLHFKELALPLDRCNRTAGTIVTRDRLARMSELHQALQAAHGRVRFACSFASTEIFRAQVPGIVDHRFDYRDGRLAPFLAIRAGETVVLGALLDWGAMSALEDPVIEGARRLELHPVQFTELACYASYLTYRFTARFGYLISPQGDHDNIKPVVLRGGANPRPKDFYRSFDRREFGHVFAEAMELDLDDVYNPETDFLWSNLVRSDGEPLELTLAQAPVGVRVVPPTWPTRHPDEHIPTGS